MDTLRQAAERFDTVAADLTDAGRRIAATGTAGADLGPPGPGRLGDLTRDLRDRWLAATGARFDEATAAATRLTEVADTLRLLAGRYADTDDAARRRQPEEA
ncbi:hypothetical protein [Polymorphospora rubra]|uniref:Excreted virulence factor EspC, type VII ESX diderm n=1 Tax=Polymorphospora rubra TaxID=338584 RepID=A0A810MV24_9ACTN|nr:hypothetical protein [Polymorphospora rubra]BCJ65046.1 hypothetical protein Prubr_20670 [Polymorphospora rubra]